MLIGRGLVSYETHLAQHVVTASEGGRAGGETVEDLRLQDLILVGNKTCVFLPWTLLLNLAILRREHLRLAMQAGLMDTASSIGVPCALYRAIVVLEVDIPRARRFV